MGIEKDRECRVDDRIDRDLFSVVGTRMGYYIRNLERRRNRRALELEKRSIQKIIDGENK